LGVAALAMIWAIAQLKGFDVLFWWFNMCLQVLCEKAGGMVYSPVVVSWVHLCLILHATVLKAGAQLG
jgi:hypothetical protein